MFSGKSLNRYLKFSITSQEWLYMVKCVLGVIICYGFYWAFPQYPFYWSIISVVLVFTPDNDQKLAFDRIKANFLGSAVGLIVYFLPIADVFLFCLGVVITIVCGIILRLENTIRPALAAVIIVLVQESGIFGVVEEEYMVAVERAICVLIGCTVALFITMVFTKAAWAKFYYKVRMRYLKRHYLKR
ncbi:FUSC family protein [Olivibacter sitiensis]|uniref:FUSC family protein n=1 Tax=Olivibacter sitiensis TaxID=376470 RepID=UPI0003F4CE7F|nr:FUSC family protein [Olivibacter sitiensis]